jgi:uncharacterized membrane protein YjjP (DUF1212 family)
MTVTNAKTEPKLGTLTTIVLVIGALASLVPGVWIFVATRNFADVAAPWADFSAHYLRDAGAFQIGLGVAVLGVLLWRDAIGVVLAGFAAGTLMHAISHGIDNDYVVAIGLAVFGLLAVLALVLRVRDLGRESRVSPR